MGVYMLEYPSPLTVYKNGQLVYADSLLDDVLPSGLDIDSTEIPWVDTLFMQPLNNAVADKRIGKVGTLSAGFPPTLPATAMPHPTTNAG